MFSSRQDDVVQMNHLYLTWFLQKKSFKSWNWNTKLLLEKAITVFYHSASIATLITNYHKKRFHRKWIKAITKEHENSARHQYNTIRNNVKRKMIQTKRAHERRICSQSTTNPKRFWKHVCDNLKTKSGIFPLLETPNDENSIKFSDNDKAEIPILQCFHRRAGWRFINFLTKNWKRSWSSLNSWNGEKRSYLIEHK